MEKNILILIDDNKNGFFPDETDDAVVQEIYKTNKWYARVIRKIALKLHVPIYCTFFTDWYKRKNVPQTIVLFDTGNAKYILSIAKKRYPNARLILWFLNSVDNTIRPDEINVEGVEFWSFDPYDCKQYNMKFNTQFFPAHNLINLKVNSDFMRDIFFVGTDKGRIEQLTKLRKMVEDKNITYDFHIVGNASRQIPGWNCNYQNKLSYKQILCKDIESKAIIDIVSSGQHGLTLRPLDAMFLKKKLITNFGGIKEYEFYDSRNIFIIDEDDENTLKSFLEDPYKSSFSERHYEMNCWVHRFFIPIEESK